MKILTLRREWYGKDNFDLAKVWAVCRPNDTNGWVHQYELNIEGLKILDFQEKNVLSWLAELMKHRDAADSKRYKLLAGKFIDKYGIDTVEYDEFNEKYNQRDVAAREKMKELINSDANKVTKVFSTLFGR